MADRKVVCRISTKSYLANLREHSFRNLANVGYYTNKFKTEVLELKWIEDQKLKRNKIGYLHKNKKKKD